jgi:hypothetical protein
MCHRSVRSESRDNVSTEHTVDAAIAKARSSERVAGGAVPEAGIQPSARASTSVANESATTVTIPASSAPALRNR